MARWRTFWSGTTRTWRKPAGDVDVISHPESLIGNDAARAIHGLSAGSDVAILGQAVEPGPATVLDLVTPSGERADIQGPVAGVMAALAELAAATDMVPLVVVAADLSTSVPALLDLLDKPGVTTGVALVLPESVDRGLADLSAVRVGADGQIVESVGTAGYVVTRPNCALLGLLRVAPS